MAVCPSFIGARVLRVTKLDSCGRPVYGPCSQVVTDGFVSVEISPEVEEGETYTQRNAAGDLCVSERGQDALQWFTVSIEFCRVDPALFTLMNPTWKVVRNAQGEPTGFRVGTKFSDREGFALELWPKATTQGAICDDDAPEDAEPNGYFLLPYVLGTAPESWTLEDGVATFTLNGRTKGGSLWGRGPYNVVHDASGNPSPLLEPIDSGSVTGDPDHFHTDIVTVAPPTPECGCQPLEAITPGALNGTIEIDTEQPNRACFEVSGSAGRQVTIDWGDGTPTVTSRVGREECHLYMETGTYTVTVADIDDPAKSSTYDVEITEVPPLPNPIVSSSPTTGIAPLATVLTVNNHGNGQVTIDWGDGTPVQTVAGGTEEEPRTYPHQFTDAGEYTVTVTSVADSRAVGTVDINATSAAPQVTVDPESGEAPLTVSILANNHGNGPVNLVFGDSTANGTNPGNGTTTTQHTYAEAGTYDLVVTSQATPANTTTVQIEVTAPAPENPVLNLAPAAGTIPVEVEATVDNQGNGPVTIDWGDGTPTSTNAGDGEATTAHTFTEGGTFTVTAASDADPAATDTQVVEASEAEAVADPTDLIVSDQTATALTVAWEWAQGEGPAVTGFSVRYRTPAGTGTWSAPQTVAAASRDLELTGLTASTAYEIGVTANAEEASSAEVLVTGSTTA